MAMKNNGCNIKTKDYYVGLDVGTNSAGWAVTDQDYNLLKFHGKTMWGARLFDEAQTAEARRTARTNRRRLARRNNRLLLLENFFAEELNKTDPNFMQRFHNSSLQMDDKDEGLGKYTLFNDPQFTDKDYMREYPTIYHLRSALIHSSEPHDVRLVFLAVHHILKSRGHFLYDTNDDGNESTLESAIAALKTYLSDNDIDFVIDDEQSFVQTLKSKLKKNEKAKALKEAYGKADEKETDDVSVTLLLELLSGKKVEFKKLFKDDGLKEMNIKSISLEDDLEADFDELSESLEDRMDLIMLAKDVFDHARLDVMLGDHEFISDAKLEQYKQNGEDLKILKTWVKENIPDEYDMIFNEHEGAKNFAAYSRYKTSQKCTQDEFCTFLKKKVEKMHTSEDPDVQKVYEKISDKTFFPKLKGTVNGLIPYQLHGKELKKILENAEGYLPFLTQKDEEGLSVSDKIISTFEFRIPYYVGPLNNVSGKHWIERTNEKIYPWNFNKVVDTERSAEKFMSNLIGRCTYTFDPVLPVNSLLYSKFTVLNEINSIKIDGKPLPVETKKEIYHDLFEMSQKKVTKKSIFNYLRTKGQIQPSAQITGIDDAVKSNLKSYHDFEIILNKTNDPAMVEEIIERIVAFGDDKKILKQWLKKNTHGLDEKDIKHILKLKYKDWGRLSKTLLDGIYYEVPGTGEVYSVIDLMYDTNQNLMEILNDKKYGFQQKIDTYTNEHHATKQTLEDRMDELYISPRVKRSLIQTLRVVDEIVDIQKAAPKKFMIEMARPDAKDVVKQRTESRKEKLIKLYKSCKDEQALKLFPSLEKETDETLRARNLYLYYLQLGKSMYTGEPIDIENINNTSLYDRDHIFPRSKIKDDSLDNLVLVEAKENRDKTNKYPLSDEIRNKMRGYWESLHKKGLISDKKFERLTRNYPLTDEELSQFVQRQLVETQQSTKALATLLQEKYPNTKIVYSKAGNVSDFRKQFDIVKFRDINDLHHAKDAYLNIVVGNVYDTKFTEKFFLNIRNEEYSLNKVFALPVEGAWKTKDHESIKIVKKNVSKNNPIVTFALVERKGALYDLQLMPKGKGQLPVKAGMDIDKYGGYNKLTGTYSCVVEHTKGKKRIRTIEPVYLMYEHMYNDDPIKYCTEVLGKTDPVIICKKILFNGVLELNGARLGITRRASGDRNGYRHLYQFAVDDERTQYLKNASNILQKDIKGSDEDLEKRYGISKSKNAEMYDWFLSRLNMNAYWNIPPLRNVSNKMNLRKEKFLNMKLEEQLQCLLEVLKTFKCNSEITTLGGSQVGIILYSNNLSNLNSAYLIHQSVTGLYETRIDLLK